jgi:hypothetical protein
MNTLRIAHANCLAASAACALKCIFRVIPHLSKSTERTHLRSQYKVQLAWSKDCQGGNWCHLGEIAGSVVPFASEGRRTPVALGFGVNGFFVDFTCGAHCNDAVIYWREGSYYYSIAMKAGKKATLLKMARSTILEARKKHS